MPRLIWPVTTSCGDCYVQYLELAEEEERAAAAATAAAAEEQRRESRAARAASGLSAAAPDNTAPAARSGSGGSSGARAPVRKLKMGFRWGYFLRSLRKALAGSPGIWSCARHLPLLEHLPLIGRRHFTMHP